MMLPLAALVLGVLTPVVHANPSPLPLCGKFIRKHKYTEIVGRNDGGDCSSAPYIHFRYNRTITQDIYEGGYKYYCGPWAYMNQCTNTYVDDFPDCPGPTCTSP